MKTLKEALKQSVRILKNAEVNKLKEYAQSYGKPTTIKVDYVLELHDKIVLVSKFGNIERVMKKGTKVLISWSGKEIKVSTLLKEIRDEQKKVNEEIKKEQELQRMQLEKWEKFLKEHPDEANRYFEACDGQRSGFRSTFLKTQYAEKINHGTFEKFFFNSTMLMEVLRKVVEPNQ